MYSRVLFGFVDGLVIPVSIFRRISEKSTSTMFTLTTVLI